MINFPFRTGLNSLEELSYELLHVGSTTLSQNCISVNIENIYFEIIRVSPRGSVLGVENPKEAFATFPVQNIIWQDHKCEMLYWNFFTSNQSIVIVAGFVSSILIYTYDSSVGPSFSVLYSDDKLK